MGPQGAVSVIFRRELAAAENADERRLELVDDYRNTHASATYSARKGNIDNIIAAHEVRNTIITCFELLREKISGEPSRRHSNIQL